MTWKSWLQGTTAAGLIVFSSACTAHWVVASQPEPQPSGYAVVDPPPEPVEVIPPRPGVHYVWVKGHWMWRAPVEQYQWAPGHWLYTGQDERARDEHGDRDDHGEQARGDNDARRGDRDHYVEDVHSHGHPPRDRAERVPPAPGRDYTWINGRWVWHQPVRAYEWEAGRWERPARVGRTDEPGRTGHERPGDNNGNGRGNNGHQPDSNGRGAENKPTEPQGQAVDTHPMIRPVHPVEMRPVDPSVPGTKPVIDGGDPQPIAKHPTSANGHAAVMVYATKQPPHDRIEKVPPRPHADAVWMAGHWDWRVNEYRWSPGHWVKPEAGFHAWTPGHWAHEARGWYYVEGNWR